MVTISNRNHPVKGSRITVEPIRELADIKRIKRLLSHNPRDLLLFVLGCNSGLRAGDLLKLKVAAIQSLAVGDVVNIIEGKTGKQNVLVINEEIRKAINTYMKMCKCDEGNFLFLSNKGENRPLTIQSVNRMIKTWCRAIKLKGNFGAHTLRKTWGYVQRVHFKVPFEIITKRYNHSAPTVTMRYLGIQEKEVYATLMHNIG